MNERMKWVKWMACGISIICYLRGTWMSKSVYKSRRIRFNSSPLKWCVNLWAAFYPTTNNAFFTFDICQSDETVSRFGFEMIFRLLHFFSPTGDFLFQFRVNRKVSIIKTEREREVRSKHLETFQWLQCHSDDSISISLDSLQLILMVCNESYLGSLDPEYSCSKNRMQWAKNCNKHRRKMT